MTAKQCLELLQSLPNNDSDAAETNNDESGSEADWVCENESSSSSEENASEVPGPSAQRGRRRASGRRSNPVAALARMPATSPASSPAPDPASTSPEAAASPAVAPAPPGTQEAGNDGTVWSTVNPGVEAEDTSDILGFTPPQPFIITDINISDKQGPKWGNHRRRLHG
ncbi:UNVERIFIED_CONTAM: hypothetical protein FKN15_066769 [Acipenser sinensis]